MSALALKADIRACNRHGRFCRQRLDKPRDFFRQFSAESLPGTTPNPAAVMRGVCKMCTIQTSRRPPIARQKSLCVSGVEGWRVIDAKKVRGRPNGRPRDSKSPIPP